MTTLVFVSPHLDDAVLSCGGAIFEAARAGARVVVMTVFTEGAGAARRRAEDRAAVTSLGAEPLHLGLLDAPERLALPRTHRALVEDSVVTGPDVTLVRSAVTAALSTHSLHPARIFAPLGVGDHIDHRVVHAALSPFPSVTFYEDRPYAFLPGSVPSRLSSLPFDPTPFLSELPDASTLALLVSTLPHLQSYTDPSSRLRLASRLRSLLPVHVHVHVNVPGSPSPSLLPLITCYPSRVLDALTLSIRSYRSQLPSLFGSASASAITSSLLRASSSLLSSSPGLHAERTFTPATTSPTTTSASPCVTVIPNAPHARDRRARYRPRSAPSRRP